MDKIINKKALVEIVAEKMNMTKKRAYTMRTVIVCSVAVDTVFEEITNVLAEGGKADIAGFGKFEVSERPARMGINPATKEKMPIPASKAPKFKASKSLKDAVK